MGVAPHSSKGGAKPKVLDIERIVAGADPYWYYNFSDIDGFEKLSISNFSIIRINLRTHGSSSNMGYIRIESYDSLTGILHMRHDGYLSTDKAVFRITFGNVK